MGRKRWIGWIAAAGLMAPTLSLAKPAGETTIAAPTTGDLAMARLQSGDRVGALKLFEQASVEQPRDAWVWRMVGDLRFADGNKDGALDAWEAGLAERPVDPVLLRRVARGAFELGDYAISAEIVGRIIDAGVPEKALRGFLGMRSEMATLAGDYSTAEEAARRLIDLAPKDPSGHLALAYMHLQAYELDDAEAIYADVLAVEPDNTTALNNLGNIHYLRRDLDSAGEQFETILGLTEVTPYSESLALSNLAELFQLQGAHGAAEKLYREAIEVRPQGAWGYMGLAALYDVTGRYDEAVDAMIDGWERDGNRLTRLNMHFYQPEWHWQRDALIAEIEGEVRLAETLWTRVLHGEVESLRAAAAWHLRALDSLN